MESGNIEASFSFFADQQIDQNAKILEIGCNFGSLLNKIRVSGYSRIYGCDINSIAISEGKQHYPLISDRLTPYDGETLPYNTASFDIVLSFDVIEHIPNPDQHFEEVNRVLRPNGLYIFQTPNKIINSIWSTYNHKSFSAWQNSHCSLHTLPAIKTRIKKHNFRVVNFSKRALNDYDRAKIASASPKFERLITKCLNALPLSLSPDFWCVAQKHPKRDQLQ